MLAGGSAAEAELRALWASDGGRAAFRYLGAPPISDDDLKTLAELRLAARSAGADAGHGEKLLSVMRVIVDPRRFPWIAANVIDKKTGKPFGGAESFVIREFDGVKIGIFGLVLPETKTTSRPGPDVDFLNPCETAKKVVSDTMHVAPKLSWP